MDRERLVSEDPERWEDPPQYNPVQQGPTWRGRARKSGGPLAGLALLLAKWSIVLAKFSLIFIALGAYALFWGWKFAIGVVVLIFIHELGHYIEAKREGLDPKLPIFVPFMGAYVKYTRGHPWQTARVAIAGPILGGAASFVFYLYGQHQADPRLFEALAYFGFFLNLFNMIPIGFFDGGAVWSSARYLRIGGARHLAYAAYALYFATAAMLVLGMIASHVPQGQLHHQ
jgi:Zn-dependent protease